MKNAFAVASLLLCLACREQVVHEEAASTTTAAATAPSTETATGTVTATATAPATSAAIALPAAPPVKGPKLRPVDEAPSESSFAAYRAELLAAVRARDVEKIVALSDPKIRTDFGGGGGTNALRSSLRDEKTVADLEQLLTLGGTFRGEGAQRSFWAPYVYSAWPDAQDAFESLAVLGENVPLRASDAPNAPMNVALSYDIVRRHDAPGKNVKTADGRIGWVDPKLLRSPIALRAGFMQSGGKWRMNALVAGD